jgi:hypothetical protein
VEAPFRWRPRPGFAPAAVYPPGVAVPRPLEAEAAEGGTLVWLPLVPGKREAGRRALAALPPPALLLFPPRPEDVPRVVQDWLALHREAPQALDEARLQVTEDPAALRSYLAAEEALWEAIYAIHPHTETSDGLHPRALAEAHWLLDAILGSADYEERHEFLTLAALETIAKELLLTVRKAELQHLQAHLEGQDTVMGW